MELTAISFVFTVVLFAISGAIAWNDARTMRIPDHLNICLFAAGVAATVGIAHVTVLSAAMASVIGPAVLLLVRTLYKSARDVDGLGLGDVKFVTAAGPWVGIEGLPTLVLFACSGALIWLAGSFVIGSQVRRTDRVPFGPFLSIGLVIVWIKLSLS